MKILSEHASSFRRIETGVIPKVGLCILNVSKLLQFLHFNALKLPPDYLLVTKHSI